MDGRLELRPGQSVDINATQGWSGRFWGRFSCSFDNSGQGSCVPPATLAEFTLDSPVDFYDVSLVDRYNMLESIFPSGRSGECKAVTCVSDLNQRPPKDLQVLRNGTVVACNSACMAFNKPEYCCSGAYSTPETSKPTEYSKLFKASCPTSYSQAYDAQQALSHAKELIT